ncbi:MAG: hypothetical protein ISR49_01235 [Alphaproteobacteria bacterium]|nr:hypothetical protein [Alphaproteobacteria bacterium]MBL6936429.1 hypothetical protein [Alphaproteobacteria bacterium]
MIGVAQERLLHGAGDGDSAEAIETAQETLAAAVKNLESVGAATAKLLAEFPHDQRG